MKSFKLLILYYYLRVGFIFHRTLKIMFDTKASNNTNANKQKQISSKIVVRVSDVGIIQISQKQFVRSSQYDTILRYQIPTYFFL